MRSIGNFGLLLLGLLLVACGADPESRRHEKGAVSFELPGNWRAVPDRGGRLFAPKGVEHERVQIEVRTTRNSRVSAQKIVAQWEGQERAARAGGNFLRAGDLEVNDLMAYEIVKRSPAPPAELIPLEHQVAGDRTFHQVELLGPDQLSISTHLLVEDGAYEENLAIYMQMLSSLRVTE